MFLDLLRSCTSYGIFFLYCAVMVLPAVLLICLPVSYPWAIKLYGLISKMTFKFLLFSTFLPVTYQGFEYLPKKPVIFVANHQSNLDILLIGSVVGARPCAWLAKSDLFEYPLLGSLLGNWSVPVYLNGDRPADYKGAVQGAVEKLVQGFSIIIFPEAGRYNDGIIHPFYSGFAAMAKLSGAQVVPLFISGAGQAMPAGARLIRSAPLMITVGKPMICGADESVQSFKERVYEWFVELNFRRAYLLEHYGIRICNGDAPVVEGQTAQA